MNDVNVQHDGAVTEKTAELMFCFQCEQTAQGKGCTQMGVCGKNPEVAAIQDLLIYALKGLSLVAVEGRKRGITDKQIDRFVCEAAFSTLTNVNFDLDRLAKLVHKTVGYRDSLNILVKLPVSGGSLSFLPAESIKGLVDQGRSVGIRSEKDAGSDAHSLRWALIYGVKGISAYADHAAILGKEDPQIYAFVQEGLAAAGNPH